MDKSPRVDLEKLIALVDAKAELKAQLTMALARVEELEDLLEDKDKLLKDCHLLLQANTTMKKHYTIHLTA